MLCTAKLSVARYHASKANFSPNIVIVIMCALSTAEKRKLDVFESIDYFAPNSAVYRKWLARQVTTTCSLRNNSKSNSYCNSTHLHRFSHCAQLEGLSQVSRPNTLLDQVRAMASRVQASRSKASASYVSRMQEKRCHAILSIQLAWRSLLLNVSAAIHCTSSAASPAVLGSLADDGLDWCQHWAGGILTVRGKQQ